LLFEIKELGECVWISAFDIKPDGVEDVLRSMQEKFPDISVQLVDLDKVAGSRYLLLATVNALKSFRSKQPIARSLSMEILLYVAANRQIGEALKNVGVTAETRKVAAIVVSKSREQVLNPAGALREMLKKEESDQLVDKWDHERIEHVRSALGIGDKEIRATLRKNEDTAKAVERLAIERSAMLTIKK
jgi:tRNA threonylcarbamoyladenosine modification (KEOPS) complex Cgi121 subunit